MVVSTFCKRLRCMPIKCFYDFHKHYSTGGTTAALRPFYLAVHPDLLWQHPSKREVNENSLKHLNQFIESLQNNVPPVGPNQLQFYLRQPVDDSGDQLVTVVLDGTSLNATIASILSSCNFSLPESKERFDLKFNDHAEESLRNKCFFHKNLPVVKEETLNRRVAHSQNVELSDFLSKKRSKAQSLVRGMHVARRATLENTEDMKTHLRLTDLVWDNQWTWLQNRNCIEDLRRLSKQYNSLTHNLAGRTLVFGDVTGIHLNGDIVFGCRDSRRLWIELLENIPKHNQELLDIWKTEGQIEEQLKGTRIVHSCWTPSRNLSKYLFWANNLSAGLASSDSRLSISQLPLSKPIRIALDSDSVEMRVLPAGEIVLCQKLPLHDIEAFIESHIISSAALTESFRNDLDREFEAHCKCVDALDLGFLYRDVNLSPDKMRKCCARLMDRRQQLKEMFQNLHICISSYYLVNEDGTICIPWDWKDSKLNPY